MMKICKVLKLGKGEGWERGGGMVVKAWLS